MRPRAVAEEEEPHLVLRVGRRVVVGDVDVLVRGDEQLVPDREDVLPGAVPRVHLDVGVDPLLLVGVQAEDEVRVVRRRDPLGHDGPPLLVTEPHLALGLGRGRGAARARRVGAVPVTRVRTDHGGDDEGGCEAAQDHARSEDCSDLHSLSLFRRSGIVCKRARS